MQLLADCCQLFAFSYNNSDRLTIRLRVTARGEPASQLSEQLLVCAELPTQLTWSSDLLLRCRCRWTNDLEFAVG